MNKIIKPKHNQKGLINKINLYIKENQLIQAGDHVIAAVSGGPDSMCLLDILIKLQKKLNYHLSLCHYNHKIRGMEGDEDEEFVKKFACSRGVEAFISSRGAEKSINNEDDARKLRYEFFEKLFNEKGRESIKIALAHNNNDYAETFLLRLLRGSGLKGLSSILPLRDFYIRPLLRVNRDEIIAYLTENQIPYRVDSSNLSDKYLRNKIRNKLLPELNNYNPNIIKTIANTAYMVSSDYQYISEQAEEAFQRIIVKDSAGDYINREGWFSTHSTLRPYILLYWMECLGSVKDISSDHIQKIIEIIQHNRGKKKLPLPSSLRFEFKNGNIYIYKQM
mgnify:CR=1 FL=1